MKGLQLYLEAKSQNNLNGSDLLPWEASKMPERAFTHCCLDDAKL
jgi:hypothetical protein